MFRCSPLGKEVGPSPLGLDSAVHTQIPEDEQTPITAIPERPHLYGLHSGSDSSVLKSVSWTSQAAAYDENPKYTTANQSYTHRRRRSSMITNLIAGSDDPYQPKYEDWREGVNCPESQKPRKSSWSLFEKRRTTFEDERTETTGKKRAGRIFATLLVLTTVMMSGLWIFGGPMPIVPPEKLNLTNWDWIATIPKVPEVDWRNWSLDQYTTHGWRPTQKLEKVKEWVPTLLKRTVNVWNRDSSMANTSILPPPSGTSTQSISINPELKSFGVETLAKVTRKTSSTGESPSPLRTSETIVGHPVMARMDDGTEATELRGSTPSSKIGSAPTKSQISQ